MVTVQVWHIAVAQFQLAGRLTETTITTLGAGVIVLLILLSGFFSSSEIAMFSLERHRIKVLAEHGRRGAAAVAELTANPHRLLVTILVGNNLANVAMSSLATALIGLHTTTPGTAVLISTFGITAIVLLFGEAAPKSYAIEHTESWALRIARPLQLAESLLLPFVVLFDHLTKIVNWLVGGHSPAEAQSLSRDEIREIIQTGERERA